MKNKIILVIGLIAIMSIFVYASDIIAQAGDVYILGKLGIGTMNPQAKLDVNGTMTVNNNRITNVANPISGSDVATKSYVNMSIPKGVILMWSGSISSIPTGCWHIADGTNGTINLENKFIVGAGYDYSVSQTGGEATHALTIAEMPAHTHAAMNGWTTGTTISSGTPLSYTFTSSTSGSTGSGAVHENRPPYYALAYIQKIC